MRVVVVGASSGLGRCVGVGLAKRGANVALLARREDRLIAAALDAGPGTLAIRCDVTDAASCCAAIDEAATGLGGIDAVVYTPGIGILGRIEDLDSAAWHRVFDTNVVGAWEVAKAALPHLKASRGTITFMTSMSASLTAPWPGLSSYIVTKAALDKLVEAWRAEHPEVGFTRLIVGECVGGVGDNASQFGSDWDPAVMGEMLQLWIARGLLTDKLMEIDDFVEAVEGVLRCGASTAIPSIAITPRRYF